MADDIPETPTVKACTKCGEMIADNWLIRHLRTAHASGVTVMVSTGGRPLSAEDDAALQSIVAAAIKHLDNQPQ